MKKLFILLSVTLMMLSCQNNQQQPAPKKEKLNTYEVVLQSGDTTYIEAAKYYNLHLTGTFRFYKNDRDDSYVADIINPISVKQIR